MVYCTHLACYPAEFCRYTNFGRCAQILKVCTKIPKYAPKFWDTYKCLFVEIMLQ